MCALRWEHVLVQHWILWSPGWFLTMNCCVHLFRVVLGAIILLCLRPMRMCGLRICIAAGIQGSTWRKFHSELVTWWGHLLSFGHERQPCSVIKNGFFCLKSLKGGRIFHFIVLVTWLQLQDTSWTIKKTYWITSSWREVFAGEFHSRVVCICKETKSLCRASCPHSMQRGPWFEWDTQASLFEKRPNPLTQE